MARMKFEGNGKQQMKRKVVQIDDEEDDPQVYDEEYNVEYLYGKKFENGQIKYYVKWENYTLEESSFEPVENLQNVVYNMRGFEKRMSELIFKIALLGNAKKSLPIQQVSQPIEIVQPTRQVSTEPSHEKPLVQSVNSNYANTQKEEQTTEKLLEQALKQSPTVSPSQTQHLRNISKSEETEANISQNSQNKTKTISVHSGSEDVTQLIQQSQQPQQQQSQSLSSLLSQTYSQQQKQQQQQQKEKSKSNEQQQQLIEKKQINDMNVQVNNVNKQNQHQQNKDNQPQQNHQPNVSVGQSSQQQQQTNHSMFKQPNAVKHSNFQQQTNRQFPIHHTHQNGSQISHHPFSHQLQNSQLSNSQNGQLKQERLLSNGNHSSSLFGNKLLSQSVQSEKMQKSNSSEKYYQQKIDQTFTSVQKQAAKVQQQQQTPLVVLAAGKSSNIESEEQTLESKQQQQQQKNKSLLQFREPVLESELVTNGYSMQVVLDETSKYGNFRNGDIPLKILKHSPYTRIQKVIGMNVDLPCCLYFKVQFKARPSGVTPSSAYIAFSELKERYPRLLLEYYEQHAILIDPMPEKVAEKTEPNQNDQVNALQNNSLAAKHTNNNNNSFSREYKNKNRS